MRHSIAQLCILVVAAARPAAAAVDECVDYRGFMHWAGVWDPGSITVVAADERYVYAAGSAFYVLDLSDPVSPVVLGTSSVTAGNGADLEVAGDHVYLTHQPTATTIALEILDVSIPSAPRLQATLTLPGRATDAAISGPHAFVVNASSLFVVDISEPSAPVVVGSLEIAGATAVAAMNDVVCVGTTSALQLHLVDVSDPTHPVLRASSFPSGSSATAIALSGYYAYVVRDAGALSIFDIRSSPTLVASIGLGGIHARRLDLVGSLAFVAAYDAGLQVVDVSKPWQPRLVGGVDTVLRAFDVAVHGTHAYVADVSRLQIVDVSNPQSPPPQGGVSRPYRVSAIEVAGSYAYLSEILGLAIADISKPRKPKVVGTVGLPFGGEGPVVVSGRTAYVIDGHRDVVAIDVTDPSLPREVGRLEVGAQDLAISGPYLLILARFTLLVADVSSPSAPAVVATLALPAGTFSPFYLAVEGDYAYVSDPDLQIVDVSDPTNPALRGSLSNVFGRVAVAGPIAYGFGGGLNVMDVSNPDSPLRLGTYFDMPFGSQIEIDGNFLYALWEGKTLEVVDVSDPLVPVRLGSYSLVSGGSMAFSGDRLCVIENDNRLACLPRHCSASVPKSPGPVGAAPLITTSTLTVTSTLVVTPNPARAGVAFQVTLPRAVEGRLRVYDVAGRRVSEVFAGELPAGRHFLRWDGCDTSGRRVSSGVYLVSFESPGQSLTQRVTVLR